MGLGGGLTFGNYLDRQVAYHAYLRWIVSVSCFYAFKVHDVSNFEFAKGGFHLLAKLVSCGLILRFIHKQRKGVHTQHPGCIQEY